MKSNEKEAKKITFSKTLSTSNFNNLEAQIGHFNLHPTNTQFAISVD